MRRPCLAIAATWLVASLPGVVSALDADVSAGEDLLAAGSLAGWTRVPIPPGGTLSAESPWRIDPATSHLVCEGQRSGHEWLRLDRELGDFVLHVEWAFTRVGAPGGAPPPAADAAAAATGAPPPAPRYNSGVFARNSADGTLWHQAQTGDASGGYLFANTLVNGIAQRVSLREKMKENRVKAAGEWNTYELRAVGRTLTLWVNGAVTSEMDALEVPRGYVGFEAEGFRIEFRNVRLEELRPPAAP
jgi:hypothetical protein